MKLQQTSNVILYLQLDDTCIEVIKIIIYDNYVRIFFIGQSVDEMLKKGIANI